MKIVSSDFLFSLDCLPKNHFKTGIRFKTGTPPFELLLILLANFAIPRANDNNFKLDNTLEGIETTAPVDTAPTSNDSIQ